MSTDTTLLTAEQFAELPDVEGPCELIRGEVVVSPPPSFDHGAVCAEVARLVGNYVKEHQAGRVLTNDAGTVTERGPDTVRGPDVSFYSYKSVPREERPRPYAKSPPELVFEARSPSESWPEVHAKTAEYLAAGVRCVCVVDYLSKTVAVHPCDGPPQTLQGDDELHLPAILSDFVVPISRFFD